MVTITMMRLSQGWDVKVSCLSDDAKPTLCTPPGVFPEKTMPIPNGAKLIEIDTGARFLFDEKSSEWVIQPETDEEFAQDVVALKADMQEVEGEVGDLKSAFNKLDDAVFSEDSAIPTLSNFSTSASGSVDQWRCSGNMTTKRGKLKSITIKAGRGGIGKIGIFYYMPAFSVCVALFSFDVSLSAGINTLINGIDFNYDGIIPPRAFAGFMTNTSDGTYADVTYYTDGTNGFNVTNFTFTEGAEFSQTNTTTYNIGIGITVDSSNIEQTEREIKYYKERAEYPTPETIIYNDNETIVTTARSVGLNGELGLIFESTASANGGGFWIDFANSTVGVYNDFASGTTPSKNTDSAQNLGFQIKRNHVLYISINRADGTLKPVLTITDTWSGETDSYTPTRNIYGWGKRKYIVSGDIAVLSFHDYAKSSNLPTVLAMGDSYMEGNSLSSIDRDKRYIALFRSQLTYPERFVVNARGGSYSAEGVACLNNYLDAMFTPQTVIIGYGMNESNYNVWLGNMKTLCKAFERKGTRIVLMTIPPVTNTNYNNATHASMSAWIRASGYDFVDVARIMSNNNDGVTADSNATLQDGVHPTADMHKKIFNALRTTMFGKVEYKDGD